MTSTTTGTAPASPRDSGAVGTQIDEVFVEIDYAILQHFSKHLYSSPNKAVEELITNGYDALATNVDTYLPGTWAKDCLIVWDDGTSMDVEGLKHLWWIARSPKADQGDDRLAIAADGTQTTRRMVGKFGIGKLASYAIGDRLTHLCKRENEYLLVTVDYNQAPKLGDAPDRDKGFKTPVQKLTEEAAFAYAKQLFRQEPNDLTELLARPRWTLAVVDALKPDVSLTEGRLRWVVGNGMPLRPDFSVRINGESVAPSILKGAMHDLALSDAQIQTSLTAHWRAAAKNGSVSGSISFGEGGEGIEVDGGGDARTDPGLAAAKGSWADIPALGRVHARLRLFEASLREGRQSAHGRSEGFFVYVKGRLLNPDDPKLLLADPSFGAFNRMQITIWADGLDADLLADRERVQLTGGATEALALLQQSLYLTGRAALERHDDAQAGEQTTLTALPSESREFFRQPLTALALKRQAEGEAMLDVSRARLDFEAVAESDSLMRVDAESHALMLNTAHPLYAAVRRKVGTTRRGRDALRLVELMAISDVLLEGHLLDLGIADDVVERLVSWRAAQLRSFAVRYEHEPESVIAEVEDASYAGKARFEKALATLFTLMGYVAETDGLSGKKDVLVVAPLGEDEFRFTVEAKGSAGTVANDAAEISGASAHANDAGASFSLVVAREFAGFGRNAEADAAVLKECATQVPPVSVVTVQCLRELYGALQQNHYPLSSMVEVLRTIEPPAVKLKAVQSLKRPTEKFDVRNLLDRLWQLQTNDNSGMPVSILQLKAARADWKAMAREQFERVVLAIDALSGGLLSFHKETYSLTLQQNPDVVAQAVESSLQSEVESGTDSAGVADGGVKVG